MSDQIIDGIKKYDIILDSGAIQATLDLRLGELAFSYTPIYTFGENILVSTGRLVGNEEFSSPEATPWYADRDNILSINIGEGITYIGNFAFAGCYKAVDVKLTKDVQQIGINAFDCSILEGDTRVSSLVHVTYNGSLADWANTDFSYLDANNNISPFSNPVSLGKHISFTETDNIQIIENLDNTLDLSIDLTGITSIKPFVFAGFVDLKAITFDDNTTSIGVGAFAGCQRLVEAHLTGCTQDRDQLIPGIDSYAFAECQSLTTISIPQEFILRGVDIFKDSPNVTIYFERKAIDTLWNNSWNASNVNIVWGAKERGYLENGIRWEQSFNDTITIIGFNKIIDILQIPAKINDVPVVSITKHALAYCAASEITIDVDAAVSSYTILSGAFMNCTNLKKVTVGEGVTEILKFAFKGCDNLEEIILPATVSALGEGFLVDCYNLKNINLSLSNEHYALLSVQTPSRHSTFKALVDISSNTIIGSTVGVKDAIESFTLDFTNTGWGTDYKIGKYAFKGSKGISILKIVLTDDLTIGDSAFEDCANLSTIYIWNTSNKVSTFGNNLFKYCSSLRIVYYYGKLAYWCKQNFKNKFSNPLFYDIDNVGKYTKFFSPSTTDAISDPWNELEDRCLSLDDVTTVSKIPDCTFFGRDIERISIVTDSSISAIQIGEAAFKDSKLNTFRYDGVDNIIYTTHIGKSAFENTKLTSIALQNGKRTNNSDLTNDFVISDYAFKNIAALKIAQLPSSICRADYTGTAHIGAFTFEGSLLAHSGDTDIEYPVLTVPVRFLKNFDIKNIQKLTLIEDGYDITSNVFTYCKELKTLCFDCVRPSVALLKLNSQSFRNCGQFKDITVIGEHAYPYYAAQNCLCLLNSETLKADLIFGTNNATMYNLDTDPVLKDYTINIRDYAFLNRSLAVEGHYLPTNISNIGKDIFKQTR